MCSKNIWQWVKAQHKKPHINNNHKVKLRVKDSNEWKLVYIKGTKSH